MAAHRPRIGVTRWEDVLGERIEDYWERIEEQGGEALDLHREGVAAELDGLVLTGGYDIDPSRYGEERHPKVKQIDPERDAFEIALVTDAIALDLPVLAICRGSQLLNVALGGRLLQHIEDRSHVADYRSEGYPSQWHAVRFEPGSRLRELFGADEIETNSRHHQALLPEPAADGLAVAGRAPDGVVEAIEGRTQRWVVGVQWHPERREADHPAFADTQRSLFAAFVGATQTVAAKP